jgi:hypothetical protein
VEETMATIPYGKFSQQILQLWRILFGFYSASYCSEKSPHRKLAALEKCLEVKVKM